MVKTKMFEVEITFPKLIIIRQEIIPTKPQIKKILKKAPKLKGRNKK